MLDIQSQHTAVLSDTPDDTKTNLFDLKPKFLLYNKYPKTSVGKAFADRVSDMILAWEHRANKRRKADQLIFQQQVYALASEVACFLLQGWEEDYIVHYNRSAKCLGNRNTHQAAFVTRKLADVMDAFEGLGLVKQKLGNKHPKAKRGVATQVFPMPALSELIVSHELALADFKTLKPRQPIVLKAPKRQDGSGTKMDYRENDDTKRLKQEVDDINQWIAEANIGFGVDPVRPDTRRIG